MPPKTTQHPCLRCRKNVGQVKAVQCGSCKQWAHKECEDMSDEEFNFLSKQKGGIVWHCTCCQASTARLEDAIRQLEKRVKNNEDRVDQIESREKVAEERLSKVEGEAAEARKALKDAQKDTVKIVFEEMRERDERRCNLIFHNVGETQGESME